MRIFDIVKNGVLEEIFKNTATKIICDQWDIADPDRVCDTGDIQTVNEIEKRVNPLIKKDWYNLLEKHNIQQSPIKSFKRIFQKHPLLTSFSDKLLPEKLSLDKIYNQHLKYDDKVAVMCEDAAGIQDYDYHNPGDYPVFLLNQETVAKIAVGCDALKKNNPEIDTQPRRSDRITISQAIEAAGDYSYEVVKTDIKYEDLRVLREAIIDKIKTEITKNDKYYFHSTSEYERMILFFRYHKIQIINALALDKNYSKNQWMEKDENIDYYCFFKNLHLFDIKGCLHTSVREMAERPDAGFVCLNYKDGNYLFVPKDLASAWLKESLVTA
jgi:hypothetical protein